MRYIPQEKDLEKVIQNSPLSYSFNHHEKSLLRDILSSCKIKQHKKGEQIGPKRYEGIQGELKKNIYYVMDGFYFEKCDVELVNKEILINQDLITRGEIFGEEFLNDLFLNYWEAGKDSSVLVIPRRKQIELIKELWSIKSNQIDYLPNILENLDQLRKEKLNRVNYLSIIRLTKLGLREKTYGLINFLSNYLDTKMLNKGSEYFEMDGISQTQLAMFIGASRENLNRILRKDNIIKNNGERMYIKKNFKEILLNN